MDSGVQGDGRVKTSAITKGPVSAVTVESISNEGETTEEMDTIELALAKTAFTDTKSMDDIATLYGTGVQVASEVAAPKDV